MNKEAMRKLLEDCWITAIEWREYEDNARRQYLKKPNNIPDRDTYITSKLSAMEQVEGTKWVKASDRRPDIEGEYYAKDSMGEKCISFFYGGHWKSVTGNPIVEWLDESPSDGQDWISVLNIIKEKISDKGFGSDGNKQADLYLFVCDEIKRCADSIPKPPSQ